MNQQKVKIGDKVEFKFIERSTGIDYGVLIGVVQDIHYPYEHDWIDIQIACKGYEGVFEIDEESVIRIINDDEC